MRQLAIIGSGPAGYTAAIYAARANIAPLLFSGLSKGGQLTTTTEVENYPGFPEGIMGPELMVRFEQQAVRFGTEMKDGCEVTKVAREEGGLRMEWTDHYQGGTGSELFATIIIATGASARYLGLPGEKDFLDGTGRKSGLTACATCDGAFYKGKEVIVIGGGDTACEEASFLTKFATQVYLVHRRDQLRASKIMAERALKNPKIKAIWNKTIADYHTDAKGRLEAVTLLDTANQSQSRMPIQGVFMAIGHTPNTKFLAGSGVEVDANGYIEVRQGCQTSIPGLFAAGDVRDHTYRQAVTAAGMGCMAALEAERYLASQGHH